MSGFIKGLIVGGVIGGFVGGFLGVVFTCCCVVAGQADDLKGIDEQ